MKNYLLDTPEKVKLAAKHVKIGVRWRLGDTIGEHHLRRLDDATKAKLTS